MKLRVFATLKKAAKNKVKNKVIPIESHSNMFGQLALLEVFEYPIGSYPPSLCGSQYERTAKTCKSTLLQILEKGFDPEKQIDKNNNCIRWNSTCSKNKNIREDIW